MSKSVYKLLESLQVLKNQNIMQQAEVDNAEVQNNQARTLDFGNVDNFENKTHSIRLTIVRRTQLLDQNPVCEDQLGSDFSFG
ncbi:MAG: hypothetical protein HWD59_07810 [Coxiellaceae bacterium]|nr:MAG: hypothetical protein HWD59_07810 [Coxiellaceae bacterium]